MIQTDAEIDFMLQDAGENTLASCGTASAYGIFRRNTPLADASGDMNVGTFAPTLLIRRGTLPDLATDADVFITNTVMTAERFVVRDAVPDQRSSEKLTRVILAPGDD